MSIVQDLSKKTVMEIKSYAKKNDINLHDAKTRVEMLEVISNWTPVEKIKIVEIPQEEGKDAAVFSERHVFWNGVGTLERGYNIVTKEESEKWIIHKSVRIATPQEVARYYGKQI
jgi:hypothetical protein